jgi:hypothetical protein
MNIPKHVIGKKIMQNIKFLNVKWTIKNIYNNHAI